jgi:hypothetical protein
MKGVTMEEVRMIHPVGATAMARKVKKLPTKLELGAVVSGNSVRISIYGEDFWCEVNEVLGDLIVAVVDADLLKTTEHGLSKGDVVRFHNNSVFQIFVPEV